MMCEWIPDTPMCEYLGECIGRRWKCHVGKEEGASILLLDITANAAAVL